MGKEIPNAAFENQIHLAKKSLEPHGKTAKHAGILFETELANSQGISAKGNVSRSMVLHQQRLGNEVPEKMVLVGNPFEDQTNARLCLVPAQTRGGHPELFQIANRQRSGGGHEQRRQVDQS